MKITALFFALATAAGLAAAEDWQIQADAGGFFRAGSAERFNPRIGQYQRSVVLSAARRTPAAAGTRIEAVRRVELDPAAPAKLFFRYADGVAVNRGHLEARLNVNGQTRWSTDAGLDDDGDVEVVVPPEFYRDGSCEIAFEAVVTKAIVNFGLDLAFDAVCIEQNEKLLPLAPVVPAPENFIEVADTAPVPALPPRNPDWMKKLVAVQAWFQPDYNLMKRTGEYLPLVRDELKMNAICVRPPAVFTHIHQTKPIKPGHAHVPKAAMVMTDADLEAALAKYRAASFRVIMYTSIAHIGHAPEWNSGELQKLHPDWLQRGPNGETVQAFGNLVLCPNTGALDYAIAYSKKLVDDYQVDALMFDNSFYQVPQGEDGIAACYCADCRKKFKAYMLERYGDQLEPVFGIKPGELDIPVAAGPLKNLWIDWRNRCWGEAMEKARAALPVPIFANTEYMWRDWQLAVDRQYRHEDAVFSESNSLANLPEKYTLGNAFAPDRPHYSYLVAYTVAGEKFWLLRPPAEVAELIGTTLLANVHLWLMFHGWDPELGYPEPVGDANAPSQEIARRYFQFRHNYRDWFSRMKPRTEIGVVCSSRNRMYGTGRNYPAALPLLLRNGFAVGAIHDLTLADADLAPFRFIVADAYEHMSEAEAERLAAFAAAGGTVFASPEAGRRDQFGRIRPESILLAKYRAANQPAGKIEIYRDHRELLARLTELSAWKSKSFLTVTAAYTLPDGRTLIQVMAQQQRHQKRDFTLPAALAGKRVKLHSPHLAAPLELPVRRNVVQIPENVWYGILEIH